MKIKEERTYLAQDKEKLLRLTRGRNTLQKVVLRANIILKIMEGLQKKRIAEQLGTTRPTVYLWINRYEKGGIEGLLKDASRSGRKPIITEEKEHAIVDMTLHNKPGNATHWRLGTMAKE